jgi:N6-L-threonylcarbamoyladenine synthase/protein kinase Bud32
LYPRYDLIYRGAEAELWKSEYLGMPAVEKHRVPKTYRIKEIDDRIRRERIVLETNMLVNAKKAVKTPHVFDVDLEKKSLLMEFIEGDKIKDLFLHEGWIQRVSKKIGKDVAALHAINIVHGDLTTSNMILNEKEGIYFIDFGLATKSEKTEDKAMDLVVFKKMLQSTHYKYFNEIWSAFLDGYSGYKKSGEVVRKITEIEKRARYVER